MKNIAFSDRMFFDDADKYDDACQKVFGRIVQNFAGISNEQIESFLTAYFKNPVKLKSVHKQTDGGHGNPIWIFTYSLLPASE